MSEYFPISPAAQNSHYLGPLPWSPRNKIPAWWDELDENLPIVYVSLGSSGQVDLLPIVLDALAPLAVSVIAVTAGRTQLETTPDNAFVSDYLPGDKAAARASLMICNGGSLSTYQAIQGSTPVLGVVGNLDQHLNMNRISRAGIGAILRNEHVTLERLRALAQQLLTEDHYKESVNRAQRASQQYTLETQLPQLIHQALSSE